MMPYKDMSVEYKIKSLMFDLSNEVGKELKKSHVKIEIVNQCLFGSITFEERKEWADILLNLEIAKIEMLFELAAQVLGIKQDLVYSQLVTTPSIDPTGMRLNLTVWDEEVDHRPAGDIH